MAACRAICPGPSMPTSTTWAGCRGRMRRTARATQLHPLSSGRGAGGRRKAVLTHAAVVDLPSEPTIAINGTRATAVRR